MYRRSSAAWPACFLAFSGLFAATTAGPLGPLPNVTSIELGIKEGSCSVGDVVYMPGDEFPGSSPCEKCACASGGVQCSRQRCEPRPGCKALHRPDHCCPTYQCECEQEGRVYGNGEKLVDPADPCRVCYCQGGEVVCRRIACFVRDDCRPRLVPGRCCPEYDNCPLRGVTSIPGMVPTILSMPEASDVPAPVVPKENIEQKITIKEITPVSEIPVITEVKIKEILPSPSIEVAEYSSSKSPLIPREATSEKVSNIKLEATESPVVIEIHKPPSPTVILSAPESTSASESISVSKSDDLTPSKISFSTQDSINSEIYPSNVPSLATIVASSSSFVGSETPVVTKSPTIVEEEEAQFEHNPAFPPLPDDFSVLSNHDDEIVEQNMDGEHAVQEVLTDTSTTTSSQAPTIKEIATTTENVVTSTTTEKVPEVTTTIQTSTTTKTLTSTNSPITNDNSMLNLRSAIPTEILNSPSLVPEDITGELDEIETTTTTQPTPVATTTINVETTAATEKSEPSEVEKLSPTDPTNLSEPSTTTVTTTTTTLTPTTTTTSTTAKAVDITLSTESPKILQEQQTTSSIARSNVATEVTSHTEISSLPVETSDQNPHEAPDSIVKEKTDASTLGTPVDDVGPTKIFSIEPEVITVSKAIPLSTDNLSTEIVETTEFVLTSFGSSESATDAVELIKISPDTKKSAAIIETAVERKKNNLLADLINLVGDVATISNHTDGPVNDAKPTAAPTSISDSEELIPVNAGYKSKNSNWNLNSITEIPMKSKNQAAITKQKVIEIEDDDEAESITDHPPPNDRIEPTTRRPIIDNVSDDMAGNKTDKNDIEIIKQAYVPTAGSRPTKVVMEGEKSTQETVKETNPVVTSAETATDQNVSASSEATSLGTSSEAGERIQEESLTSTETTQ